MFKRLTQWFVPSESNGYEPHVLRVWPATILLAVIVLFFGVAQFVEHSLTDSDSFLAAVVSSVLVDLTNIDRSQEGLHGLSVNPVLVAAAQLKANDMAQDSYFAHNSPDGKSPWYWFGEAGYSFSYAGENLAVFFGDSEDVERAWMNSPSHRANILNSSFTEIGIATAEGYYQGQKTVFVVQMFGTPAASASIATIESTVVPAQTEEPVTGEVSGESVEVITEANSEPVQEEVEIIHQDETFIAVKSDAPAAPSTEPVAMQSTVLERLIASPQTLLSYTYSVLSAIVALALILLIVLEFRVQRPKNILFGILLLVAMGTLFYFSYSDVVVAGTEGISRALQFPLS